MPRKTEKVVEVTLDLGDLKPVVQRAAKRAQMSMNEFICNAVELKVEGLQADREAAKARQSVLAALQALATDDANLPEVRMQAAQIYLQYTFG